MASLPPTRVLRSRRYPIAWLAIIAGKGRGRDFRLGAVTNIGRDGGHNDIVLNDDALSANHARIKLENNTFVLYDLASSNGTSVNGERIERVLLRDGDKVQMGETVFVFKVA